jgi:predicted RNase H-like HicB family nuclease
VRDLAGYSYRLSFSEWDGECVATCDEIPGLSGLGPTPARARRELEVAMTAWIDYLASRGLPAPAPAAPTRGAS